jgi:hypothetical protein
VAVQDNRVVAVGTGRPPAAGMAPAESDRAAPGRLAAQAGGVGEGGAGCGVRRVEGDAGGGTRRRCPVLVTTVPWRASWNWRWMA